MGMQFMLTSRFAKGRSPRSRSIWLSTHRSHSQVCVSDASVGIARSILLKVVVSVGGIAGYVRTKSRPSLIAGVGLGASYGLAGGFQSWQERTGRSCHRVSHQGESRLRHGIGTGQQCSLARISCPTNREDEGKSSRPAGTGSCWPACDLLLYQKSTRIPLRSMKKPSTIASLINTLSDSFSLEACMSGPLELPSLAPTPHLWLHSIRVVLREEMCS